MCDIHLTATNYDCVQIVFLVFLVNYRHSKFLCIKKTPRNHKVSWLITHEKENKSKPTKSCSFLKTVLFSGRICFETP